MRNFIVASAIAAPLLVSCSRAPSAAWHAEPSDAAPGETRMTSAPVSGAPLALDRELDPPEARVARAHLVRELVAEGDLRTDRVREVMARVPRHLFVPDASIDVAYADMPAPIGRGQTISQPAVVATMTEALELTGRERVLEIGTGSGYQAAILASLAADVYTIEIVAELGESARERLARLGYANVHVRIGDGYAGWPEHAPFDRILLTAAPAEVPQELVAELPEGGVLVAPIGPTQASQDLMRYRKRGGRLSAENLGPVRFVPMVR